MTLESEGRVGGGSVGRVIKWECDGSVTGCVRTGW